MARAKRGTKGHKRHKRTIKAAKGFFGRRKNCFTIARIALDRASKYAFRDRRAKKRDFRTLWIARIGAALREYNLPYSKFISLLKTNSISLDRKILAQMAIENPSSFAGIVKSVRP